MELLRRIARMGRNTLFNVRPFACPPHLARRHRVLSRDGAERIEKSLKANYFSYTLFYPDPIEAYFATETGQGDLQAHITRRCDSDRAQVVPWIDSVVPLEGTSILEIGCGTGSSTAAFVEQGAVVTAVDVHQGSLEVTRDRLGALGLSAELSCANAVEAFRSFEGRQFDIVSFIAVLEHMTTDERIASIAAAWKCLRPGGHLVVHETPNRLWYFDDHTSRDHFFMWLPDELALRYAASTPREPFNRLFKAVDTDERSTRVAFARWGRGVSYHDFAVALELPAAGLPVESCMELFIRERTNTGRIYGRTLARRYEAMLHSMRPEIHRGFFLPYLDLMLKKPAS